ncbi:50S ribosomal protein L23 [Candidatus Woesearchaeota archaeon]|nr:MAG: 50S ribosomal protein L23 [Candidatus Woesearchaeota archaeon]
MNPYEILNFPKTTEKAIRIMDSENKLVFSVKRTAKKPEIKKAVETAFKVKVERVRTLITPQGEKKAYITLTKDTPAMDLASDLGIM